MRFILILALFFAAGFQAFAGQDAVTVFKNDVIHITQVTEKCNDEKNGTHREYIFLKVENLSNEKIEFTFKKLLWYDGECTNCDKTSPEFLSTVVLEPKETKTTDCENRNKNLSVFSKMLDMKKSELTKFELKVIEIKKLSK